MNQQFLNNDIIVTLETSEVFLMLGDRSTCWPMIVRVLEWQQDGTYVKVSGHRAARNGEAITHQPTSECLMLGHDSRLRDFPAWLIDALSRGTAPLMLADQGVTQ